MLGSITCPTLFVVSTEVFRLQFLSLCPFDKETLITINLRKFVYAGNKQSKAHTCNERAIFLL